MPTYLVEIDVSIPDELPGTERAALVADELERARVLRGEQTIHGIWLLPKSGCNIGIWSAKDEAELRSAIESLPLSRWFKLSITPVRPHPVFTDLVQE